jgi:hypothetical protein
LAFRGIDIEYEPLDGLGRFGCLGVFAERRGIALVDALTVKENTVACFRFGCGGCYGNRRNISGGGNGLCYGSGGNRRVGSFDFGYGGGASVVGAWAVSDFLAHAGASMTAHSKAKQYGLKNDMDISSRIDS